MPEMTREQLLSENQMGEHGPVVIDDIPQWTNAATQRVMAWNANGAVPNLRVELTLNGNCYHHLSCHSLRSNYNRDRIVSTGGGCFHDGVFVKLMTVVHAYNSTRANRDQFRPCSLCANMF